jgi:hypothetical protein
MAEVVLEELAVFNVVSISSNSLSWSPCAVVAIIVLPVSAFLFIRSNTAYDSSDVLGDVLWGTEGVLWNHLSTVGEGTE